MSARSYVLPPLAAAQQATSPATAVTLNAKKGVITFYGQPAIDTAANNGLLSFRLYNNFITDANTRMIAAQAEGDGYLFARAESKGVGYADLSLKNLAGAIAAGTCYFAIYFEILN